MNGKKLSISLINLWCTKNLVDSQCLLGKFLTSGKVEYYTDPYDPAVELVYLNTCGFISSGREEAIQLKEKLEKKGKKVIPMGCAVKYFEMTKESSTLVANLWNQVLAYTDELNTLFLSETPRALTNLDQGFEYLKIAEGCDNACAFCIIPKIRGKQRSMPIEKVLTEAQNLVNQGAEELILIAQDSTRYGTDLYGKPQLFELLEQIEQVPGDFHYRVLYLYPDLLTKKQLEKLTHFDKFIPYFDLPFQHISSKLLKSMGRYYDEQGIYDLLDFIKSSFPTHFIRTNFIVGFPGEKEADHQQLINFIKKDYFDNIALFEYHDEPLATSFLFPDKVDDATLHQRFLELRQIVNQMLLKKQANLWKSTWGRIQDITETTLIIRPRLHCPEIDEVVELPFSQLPTLDKSTLSIGMKISLSS